MALTSSGGGEAPRYRLSKRPRVRTLTLSPSSGNSSSDLEATFTTAPCSISNDSLNTIKSQTSRKNVRDTASDDGILGGQVFDSTDEEEIGHSQRTRKRSSRLDNTTSKAANMRLQFGLSKSATTLGRDGNIGMVKDARATNLNRSRTHDGKPTPMHPTLDASLNANDMRGTLISPIRRRSFFTPGLATRNPVNMLAKPPAPTKREQTEWDYYYNPCLSATSPLERIAALDLAGRPVTPLTRAVTPADRDYGMIGRLRITNGAASPVPSTRTYNTAVTRHSAIIESLLDPIDLPRMPAQFDRYVAEKSEPNLDLVHSPERPFSQDSVAFNYADIFGAPAAWLKQKENYEVKVHKRSKSYNVQAHADKTSRIAQDYMSDLDKNPFKVSDSDPAMHSFVATTKPNEVDAELFDRLSLREVSSIESLKSLDHVLPEVVTTNDGFQEDIARLLARVGNSSSTLNTIGKDSTPEKTLYHDRHPDSGYQSSSSTTSYRKHLGFHSGRNAPRASQEEITSEEDNNQAQLTSRTRHRPTPVTIPTSSTFYDSIFSRPIQTSTDSIPTLSTIETFAERRSPVTPSRKLQKSRPRSLPPPVDRITVQMHPELDPESVPYVPDELLNRMVKRSAELPPLIHTLPSIGHVRLDKEDHLKAPLSAPMRFPSPQPTVDHIWEQALRATNRRPKTRRDGHASMDTKHMRKASKLPVDFTSQSSNMTDLADIDDFLRGSPSSGINDIQSDPIPCRNGPVRTLRKPTSTSQVEGLVNDRNATQAGHDMRPQSMATLDYTNTANVVSRHASSVYPDNSPAMASSVWTDATPLLRQASSVYTPAVRTSPQLISAKLTSTSRTPHLADCMRSPNLSIDTKSRKSHSTSSEKNSPSADGTMGVASPRNSGSKGLPPLPITPTKDIIQKRERSKTVDSLDKALPPLPHQRKTSNHVVPKGLSPCRESEDGDDARRGSKQAKTSSIPPTARSNTHGSRGFNLNRPAITPVEPLYRSSADCLPALHQVDGTPNRGHQPSLPQLSASSGRQEATTPRTPIWDTIMQSPECDTGGFTSDSTSYTSYSPERNHYKWAPPKPESHYRRHSDWPQILKTVPSTWRDSQLSWDHDMMHTQLIPEGLKTRKTSGSETAVFEYQGVGDHYAYGYHQAHASTRSMNGAGLGLNEKVNISMPQGIEMMDVPIFMHQRG